MGKLIINNIYGGDIELESKCGICGKTYKYRIRERKVCPDDKCYEESKKRKEKQDKNRYGNE